MSAAPPRLVVLPGTTERVNFQPVFRCWWGTFRPVPRARAGRMDGALTLNQYTVACCQPLVKPERTGLIAVVLCPRFLAWLGAERTRDVARAVEAALQPFLAAEPPRGRGALVSASAVVNHALNEWYPRAGVGALPEMRP